MPRVSLWTLWNRCPGLMETRLRHLHSCALTETSDLPRHIRDLQPCQDDDGGWNTGLFVHHVGEMLPRPIRWNPWILRVLFVTHLQAAARWRDSLDSWSSPGLVESDPELGRNPGPAWYRGDCANHCSFATGSFLLSSGRSVQALMGWNPRSDRFPGPWH